MDDGIAKNQYFINVAMAEISNHFRLSTVENYDTAAQIKCSNGLSGCAHGMSNSIQER